MKKFLKVLAVLFLIAALIIAFIFYGTTVSVRNVTIVNQTIESSKISEETSNLKIAFISDIHYNHFMNYERLENMIEKINANKPDIILFGGDLFDDPSTYPPTEESQQELITLLKSLQADLGKFAVLGEEDHDPVVSDLVENLLYQADFELLTNEHLLITKNNATAVNLIGIDSQIGGNPDISLAFENVDTSAYTIVLTHAPDIVNELPLSNIDLVLAGHSHGGQIALPFIGALQKKEGASVYSNGEYTINQTKLIVSNGLGTTESDIRIFADPQCHMIRLTAIGGK